MRMIMRLGWFMASTVLLAATSLALIPALIHASGAAAFGRIVTGQAIGVIAAVLLASGWGVTGPPEVARQDAAGRLRVYRESLITKLVLLPPTLAVGAVLVWLLNPDHRAYALAGFGSTAVIGLTAGWWFVGRQSPVRLLVGETLPRVVGSGVGIVAMVRGADALVGLLAQGSGMIAAVVLSSAMIMLHPPAGSSRTRSVRAVLRQQRAGTTATLIYAASISLPVVVVGLVAPAALPAYALLDKLVRQLVAGFSPYTSIFQGWIPHAPSGSVAVRVRTAVKVSLLVAAGLAVAVLVALPPVLGWMGRGVIHPPAAAIVLAAVVTGGAVLESVLAQACFPALQRMTQIAMITAGCTIAALAAVAVGGWHFGATGAFAGLVLGLAVQLVLELRGLRAPSSAGASHGPVPAADRSEVLQ